MPIIQDTHLMARNERVVVATNSNIWIVSPFRKLCRNLDNLSLSFQPPAHEDYRLQKNPRQIFAHAKCDVSWQEEHVRMVGWQSRESYAKTKCIQHTTVLRLNLL